MYTVIQTHNSKVKNREERILEILQINILLRKICMKFNYSVLIIITIFATSYNCNFVNVIFVNFIF